MAATGAGGDCLVAEKINKNTDCRINSIMEGENRTSQKPVIPHFRKDTGWAWLVVLGGFLVNFLVVGTAVKSFGVLYGELKLKYDSTSATAGVTIVAVTQSLCLILSPFVNMLAMKITTRRTVFIGGVLMFIGYIITILSPDINYLYFSYGVIVGIGSAMAYSPSIVMVGQYFERRRALATGLAVAGSGVGTFVNPPLVRHLVGHYGSPTAALLVLAALTLNICVAALLLRPVPRGANPPHRVTKPPASRDQQLLFKDVSRDHPYEWDNVKDRTDKSDNVRNAPDTNEDKIEIRVNDEVLKDSELNSRETECSDKEIKDNSTSGKPSSKTGEEHGSIHKKEGCLYSVKHWLVSSHLIDTELFQNALFWVYAIAVMLMFSGYPILYVMLPEHAGDIGLNRDQAGYLVSILGIFDLLGRVIFGFIADLNLVSKRYLFAGCTALAGVSICVLPLLKGFYLLACLSAFMGSFAGGFFALIPVMLSEKLGVSRLHSSYGLVVMFMGLSVLVSAPISGLLKNATEKWNASFWLSGIVMLIGTSLLLLDPLASRHEARKADRKHLE